MTMSLDPKVPRWQQTVQEPPRHGIGFEHPDAKDLAIDLTAHQVIIYSKRTGAKISISRSSKPGEYYVLYELKWPNIGSSTGERYFTAFH
ncbi:MAG: hypothetical protein NT003_04360 [Candidatus Magasanikbacteria bacterium]|nr:hypothetical protein [Candidatus Magasanikbacteria bacterium]